MTKTFLFSTLAGFWKRNFVTKLDFNDLFFKQVLWTGFTGCCVLALAVDAAFRLCAIVTCMVDGAALGAGLLASTALRGVAELLTLVASKWIGNIGLGGYKGVVANLHLFWVVGAVGPPLVLRECGVLLHSERTLRLATYCPRCRHRDACWCCRRY